MTLFSFPLSDKRGKPSAPRTRCGQRLERVASRKWPVGGNVKVRMGVIYGKYIEAQHALCGLYL